MCSSDLNWPGFVALLAGKGIPERAASMTFDEDELLSRALGDVGGRVRPGGNDGRVPRTDKLLSYLPPPNLNTIPPRYRKLF